MAAMHFMSNYFDHMLSLDMPHVNSILLQTVPDVSVVLLQLINTVHTTFIHCLLHSTPYFIIHWIQVLAAWWPEIRTNEVRRFLL